MAGISKRRISDGTTSCRVRWRTGRTGREQSETFASIQRAERFRLHPHAAAQCRRWLAQQLPEAAVLPAASTAEAAHQLATGGASYDAATLPGISGLTARPTICLSSSYDDDRDE